jgi:dTDP-4-amino-4,6-dideoxygalactose transaminase
MGIDRSTHSRSSGNGYKWQYDCTEVGYKYNGNDIMAAIASVQLRLLDSENKQRQEIYNRYQLHTSLLVHNQGSSHHLASALVVNREEIMAELSKAGYATGVHYLRNDRFACFPKSNKVLSNVDRLADKILSLPNLLGLTEEHIEAICKIINKHEKA